ncbi:MAG TPA: phosphatidylglycerophosphatase A [Candidatus Acidoferrales bacterium]
MSDAVPTSPALKKPRLALAIATGFGLGYIPKAPGTAGSLGGVALVWALLQFHPEPHTFAMVGGYAVSIPLFLFLIVLGMISLTGVWAAGCVARQSDNKDPQIVVIDEVSGQMLAFVPVILHSGNWKYLLLGFILFRVFDIWKPFPARQAERLPGGWGIMADDWVAGIYAALGLWAARALGL